MITQRGYRSPYYVDRSTDKSRETDLIAAMRYPARNLFGGVHKAVEVQFSIECKYIAQNTLHPWQRAQGCVKVPMAVVQKLFVRLTPVTEICDASEFGSRESAACLRATDRDALSAHFPFGPRM
jgi:hypothetical protein